MAGTQKTVIVTGASQGIGAAVVRAFLERDYNVVGTSRNATKSAELKASDKLVLVDGDIGQAATAQKVVDAAVQKFGSIDVVVNNEASSRRSPSLITALTISVLWSRRISTATSTSPSSQSSRCSLRSRAEASLASRHRWLNIPSVACRCPLPMITKGGLEAITRSLASEYAKEHIRFNAVAPGSLTLLSTKTTRRTS